MDNIKTEADDITSLTNEINQLQIHNRILEIRIEDLLESTNQKLDRLIKQIYSPIELSNKIVIDGIKESIPLYSIKDDRYITKLNLSNDKIIIRTCRSNTLSNKVLINRITNNKTNITVY